jgi:hypothetical protein
MKNCSIPASIKAGFVSSFGGTLIIPALIGQLEEEGPETKLRFDEM